MNHRRGLAGVLGTLLTLLLLPNTLQAQGDGPRAFQLVPAGTQTISQFAFALRGNNAPGNGVVIENADIDINLGATQYASAFDANGRQAGILAVATYGNVNGGVTSRFGDVTGSDSGVGDLMLGVVYGAYGGPNLEIDAYKAHDPGLSVATLLRVTLPTGSYNSHRNLNMGGNRWALELGVPIMYYIGKSFLDASLLSLELAPKITLFSDNNDAPGNVGKLEQDPMVSLEGHITRNFGQALWLSFDSYYEYGGETRSDGVADDNSMRSLSLGVTAALNLSPTASVKVSYGEVVSGNPAGSDGYMFRAQATLLF